MRDGQVEAPAIQVLIADHIAHIVDRLDKLAAYSTVIQVCGIARQGSEVVEEARVRQPDVLLLGAGLATSGLAALLEQLASVSPGTRVVAVASPGEGHGAPPGAQVAWVAADASGAELAEAMRTLVGVDETAPVAPAPEAEPMHDVAPRPPRPTGRSRGEVFVVHSGKGGVGKSVVASNLAVALAAEAGSRVALVDLDLQHGDAGVLLGIGGRQATIDDLVDAPADPETLDRVLATGPAGVRVLLAPPSPERAERVTPARLRAVLQALRDTHDHVVVDTPAHLDEAILETMEMADQILLVTTFNVTTVKSARATLRLLQAVGVSPERIALILNQLRPRTRVPRADIEEVLRFRMLAHLPYEAWVDDAVDSGRPIVLDHPRSPMSKQLREVVHYLVPGSRPHTPPQARGPARLHSPVALRRLSPARRWLRMSA